MKKFKKGFVITLAAAFLVSSTMATTVMATKNSEHGANKINKVEAKINGKNSEKKSHDNKDSKQEKDGFKLERSTTEGAIKFDTKEQAKELRKKIKAEIKAKYSSKELEDLKLVSENIMKNNKNVTVLSIDNIIVKGVNIKFDTPPVIKSGRTLIPVKALSQAFGANVQWLAAEKKVIITKGDKEIVLILDSNKIYVNGVELKTDVPACSINGRTVVPMKFIVEQLGLKVNWHSDTKDIEIEDSEDVVIPPVTTTDSAITVTGSAITVGQ